VLTPWEAEGLIDYDRLIREFGTQPLTRELAKELERLAGEEHFMLERGIFYSHRDLDVLLSEYEKGGRFFLYTGRGPSGPMHLGHIIPFYFTAWLQKRFNANVYIPLTDDEKFLEKERNLTLEDARRWALDNALDIIAAGFDPDRTFIYIESDYVGNVYKLAIKVARRINFSTAKAIFGFGGDTNIGFIFYPALQIVPTFFEAGRCLIPAGIDQDPFWRLQRDLAPSLGYKKAAQIHGKLLPGLPGVGTKMSASKPETAIFLNERPESVREKIWKHAFSGGRATTEEHRKYGGNPDVDVPYQWLYMFFEPDEGKLEKIRQEYVSGRLLSGELKELLIEKVNAFLEEHRERRERAKELLPLFMREGRLASEMVVRTYQ
jgi:tryptophanyl-tRNA synthetase